MTEPAEQIEELRRRVEALETAIQSDEFSALPERIDVLEQKAPPRIPKVISLAEIFTKSTGGARVVLFYIIIATICLPLGLMAWLVGWLGDNPANARSLITIVFCLGTMAVAGVLAFVAIRKDEFDKAKEVLIILIGIFGTIVGYYFGSSDLSAKSAAKPTPAAAPETPPPAPPDNEAPPEKPPTAPPGESDGKPAEKPLLPGEAPQPDGQEQT